MMKPRIDWIHLLQRVRDQAHRLEELMQRVDAGTLTPDCACFELRRSGFSRYEIMELRAIGICG